MYTYYYGTLTLLQNIVGSVGLSPEHFTYKPQISSEAQEIAKVEKDEDDEDDDDEDSQDDDDSQQSGSEEEEEEEDEEESQD
jgi:hypothetical protein